MKKRCVFIKLNQVALIALLLFNSCSTDKSSDNLSMEGSGGYYINGLEGFPNTEKYEDYEENPFIEVDKQPVSTFAVDADGGSYSNMRRFVGLGQIPPKASVRIEEYINYFTFDYPEPAENENIALNSEISTCPWNKNHYLLRLGIKGKTIPENELPDANYVFLIDVSGSMASDDLKQGLNRCLTRCVRKTVWR